jgi:hypothetical protein
MAVTRLAFPDFMQTEPPVLTGRKELGGRTYRLTFRWNPRAAAGGGQWRLDVADVSGRQVVRDLPVVATGEDGDLLRPYRFDSLRLPPGRLRVLCEPGEDGSTADPGLLDLGGRAAVEYVEDDD